MVVNHVDGLGPVCVLEPQVLASLPGSREDPAVETVLLSTDEAEVCSPQRHIVVAAEASAAGVASANSSAESLPNSPRSSKRRWRFARGPDVKSMTPVERSRNNFEAFSSTVADISANTSANCRFC